MTYLLLTSVPVDAKHQLPSESSGELEKIQIVGPHLRVSDSVTLGRGQEFEVFNNLGPQDHT